MEEEHLNKPKGCRLQVAMNNDDEPLPSDPVLDQKTNSATLTVRLIRSFAFRNWKPVVLRNISLDMTTEDLLETIRGRMSTFGSLPATYHTFVFDSLKIEYQPHGFKTNDTVINTMNDEELTLKPGLRLGAQGIQNETEISCFRMEDYKEYKASKEAKGDS